MEHYSARLGRDYASGDWLKFGEALLVLAAVNQRPISSATLSRLVASCRVATSYPWSDMPKIRGYLYDDLIKIVVSPPGREQDESNTKSNVRAQRAFRARMREKKKQSSM